MSGCCCCWLYTVGDNVHLYPLLYHKKGTIFTEVLSYYIIYMQVRDERKAGNLARAREASRSAYIWARRASVVGMTIYVTVIFLFFSGACGIVGIILVIICICAC